VAGLYFEEFAVGQCFEHLVRRTVTETDNLLFSALTMNPAAIHLDAEYSKGTLFGERIVNSVFTLGLLVGLSVYDTTYGTTIGNLGWEEVRFPRPVLIGDTLHVQTTVLSKRESQSRKDSGIVVFEHKGFNQRDSQAAAAAPDEVERADRYAGGTYGIGAPCGGGATAALVAVRPG
jgi:acyl dehydratase